ncbi:Uncharacterised protein [Zhongshania aliphaticivorans]|uniref:Lipoprotein n=1 Tax=Zhongshania aliphaticivorans TaxID=1470434 RepID=A0A5S9N2F1_9GAMM|nr:hypothetical protein [Zhongshania aliphaticivorans]CAA0082989.1 Uncharacterised protein [Zhongshania aliphaticivorans]CAA0083816.1 Uncharacterised protein [Zhongshania aliphaticivorans]
MKKRLIFASLLFLVACSNKPIPFTDYLVKNLLRDNLEGMSSPAIFNVDDITIKALTDNGDTGTATADIRLRFPEDFETVVSLRRLEPYNIAYLQYKSSFGTFSAGESQVHHAEYQFERRDGKWFITGSRAISPPETFHAAGSPAASD